MSQKNKYIVFAYRDSDRFGDFGSDLRKLFTNDEDRVRNLFMDLSYYGNEYEITLVIDGVTFDSKTPDYQAFKDSAMAKRLKMEAEANERRKKQEEESMAHARKAAEGRDRAEYERLKALFEGKI
jgi:hypothetical protein